MKEARRKEQLIEHRDGEVHAPSDWTGTCLLGRPSVRGVRILKAGYKPTDHAGDIKRSKLHPVGVGNRERKNVYRKETVHEGAAGEEGQLVNGSGCGPCVTAQTKSEKDQELTQQDEEAQLDEVVRIPSNGRRDEHEQREQIETDHSQYRFVSLPTHAKQSGLASFGTICFRPVSPRPAVESGRRLPSELGRRPRDAMRPTP